MIKAVWLHYSIFGKFRHENYSYYLLFSIFICVLIYFWKYTWILYFKDCNIPLQEFFFSLIILTNVIGVPKCISLFFYYCLLDMPLPILIGIFIGYTIPCLLFVTSQIHCYSLNYFLAVSYQWLSGLRSLPIWIQFDKCYYYDLLVQCLSHSWYSINVGFLPSYLSPLCILTLWLNPVLWTWGHSICLIQRFLTGYHISLPWLFSKTNLWGVSSILISEVPFSLYCFVRYSVFPDTEHDS